MLEWPINMLPQLPQQFRVRHLCFMNYTAILVYVQANETDQKQLGWGMASY